ncbi:hypothetical protein ACFQ1L_19225 [Phytohabitans flavus]|nr:hypothetical protein [Phytohabitans flavus]
MVRREVAAYGTALTGLEAAHRMLGTDDNWMNDNPPVSSTR